MVKIITYDLTPFSNCTLELLQIMLDKRNDNDDYYFILYTQEIGRPFKKHTYHIGPDSKIIFAKSIMQIINPHSSSIIDLKEEQGYQIESKKIGE